MQSELTRPIVGIENRTAQEVFDIMCARIRTALSAQVQDDDDRAAIKLGTSVLSKIADPSAREIAIRNALTTALSRPAQVQDVATHRHKKRCTEYVLMGVGKMQAENWRELVGEQDLIEGEEVGTAVDMREVAIYRSVDDGSLWVRPVEEFNDGRFETLPAAPAKQEGKS